MRKFPLKCGMVLSTAKACRKCHVTQTQAHLYSDCSFLGLLHRSRGFASTKLSLGSKDQKKNNFFEPLCSETQIRFSTHTPASHCEHAYLTRRGHRSRAGTMSGTWFREGLLLATNSIEGRSMHT